MGSKLRCGYIDDQAMLLGRLDPNHPPNDPSIISSLGLGLFCFAAPTKAVSCTRYGRRYCYSCCCCCYCCECYGCCSFHSSAATRISSSCRREYIPVRFVGKVVTLSSIAACTVVTYVVYMACLRWATAVTVTNDSSAW